MSATMSPDQRRAYDGILAWSLDDGSDEDATLAGYAGCGKTYTLAQVAQEWRRRGVRVAWVAPTGKAALVLRETLARYGINADVSTIHRAFLHPFEDQEGKLRWKQKEDATVPDVVVIDEASMLTEDVWLLVKARAAGAKFLYVGDHFQLPAVGKSAGVMASPTWRLETIHRQEEGSPILRFASLVRTDSIGAALSYAMSLGGDPEGPTPLVCLRGSRMHAQGSEAAVRWAYEHGDGMIVVGTNRQRVDVNRLARRVLRASGREDVTPEGGDMMIVLMNSPKTGVVNGEIVTVGAGFRVIDPGHVQIVPGARTPVAMLDESDRVVLEAYMRQIREADRHAAMLRRAGVQLDERHDKRNDLLMAYGWALTCHKSQGSQARRVVVDHDRIIGKTEEEQRRWLYTAATRARDALRLVRGLRAW
jgi:exodeoxyribonuclease-5